MPKSPILGAWSVARSKNVADSEMTNLFLEFIPTKDGREPGFLQMCPGLDLLTTLGTGPIRGPKIGLLGGNIYPVSGKQWYQLTPGLTATLLGNLATSSGPVSVIANTTQIAVFDGVNGYLTTASMASVGGGPLTGGSIGTAGALYTVGDTITLLASDGTQNATAIITVTGVSSGAVTSFVVTQPGNFSSDVTTLTQTSTSLNGSGFILTSPTFGSLVKMMTIPLPFSNPVSATYQDGFGLVNSAGTLLWYQSDLDDLSNWNPLNFSAADSTPDNIVALADLTRQVFVFKEKHTEFWVNVGQAGFTFQRIQGPFLEVGCQAPFSVAKAGSSLIWLGQTTEGQRQVFEIGGYEPKRISTDSLDAELATYSTVSDAIGAVYQQAGHTFYILTFPTVKKTWCYDVAESLMTGIPQWHRRASFSNGFFSRHPGNAFCTFSTTLYPALPNVVGDYQNGNLYVFDLDQPTDNGTPRKWVRSWRALQQPSVVPVRFPGLTIGMETGMQVPSGTNPQASLYWSDDGGHNWVGPMIRPVGKTGQTSWRVMFKRLGSTRRLTGLDRIFRLESSDPFKVSILSADIDP